MMKVERMVHIAHSTGSLDLAGVAADGDMTCTVILLNWLSDITEQV